MAILQSCCFWKTVRKGSYASAIYTLIYFGCSSIILLQYLREEQQYLSGKIAKPTGESLLERGDVSPTTVIFNILFLLCSLCLVLASVMVVIGLSKDQRHLLLPWIFFMFADIFIEFSHLVYLVKLQRLVFEPLVSVVLTLDFFIMCLNVYCLLCIISQYQEYKSGRGYRKQRLNNDAIQYITTNDTTASTLCLNTIGQNQTSISPYLYHHSNFSTIPEESQLHESSDKDELTSPLDENCTNQCCAVRKSSFIPEIIMENY
ncbi:uncharacterized protein LOC129946115 [Eupeodes corollae]|uniref:uncharacterized protein LOC129946115 n=1 Tax=Eupeodes corollae TaxID=290404 RepID=UPI00249113F5|nr:uncharacterized protein LOC129946115 [Eupeodes corollae]